MAPPLEAAACASGEIHHLKNSSKSMEPLPSVEGKDERCEDTQTHAHTRIYVSKQTTRFIHTRHSPHIHSHTLSSILRTDIDGVEGGLELRVAPRLAAAQLLGELRELIATDDVVARHLVKHGLCAACSTT